MNEDLRLHREAEVMMGRADQARAQNRPLDAARFSRQAAELEARVFELLPLDRPKTRGITAVSSVALYREAGALDQAIHHAELFLRQDAVTEHARLDLREMIEEMQAEQFVSTAYSSLTPRQQHVLALRLAGVTLREIADRLRVSPRTIQRTMKGARRQLQATDVTQESRSRDDLTRDLRQKLHTLTA